MKKIILLAITLLFIFAGADQSKAGTFNGNIDESQQGGSNISYDVPSKWYVGVDGGLSAYSNISENHFGVGAYFGYKFDQYFAMELEYQFPGDIGSSAGTNLPPGYTGSFNIISAELWPMYPFLKHFEYTLSIFAYGGYGVCLTNYQYQDNSGWVKNSNTDGAINAGVGLNLDLRANVSFRLMYLYQQVRYPNPASSGNSWADNEINFGVYYNF